MEDKQGQNKKMYCNIFKFILCIIYKIRIYVGSKFIYKKFNINEALDFVFLELKNQRQLLRM